MTGPTFVRRLAVVSLMALLGAATAQAAIEIRTTPECSPMQRLAANIAALAQASWDQTLWNPLSRKLPVEAAPTVEGPAGGNVVNYPGCEIANTDDAPLYQTCRYGLEGYNLKLPNGRYRVTLKFCEPHFDAANKRIGDFKLQDKTVVEGLDIFARVGKFAALDLALDDIEVTDGWLRLKVEARTSLPCISAIVAEGKAATRKINCGGAAYKDWEADDVTKTHFLPVDDFYADWAQANFGLAEAGKVFTAIDGGVPQVTDGGCPSGQLTPVATPWAQVAPQFTFVEDFEKLRPNIQGAGNLERFDYWLNTFRYLRALMKTRCAMGAKQAEEVSRAWAEAYSHLLASVSTPGGLAMVVNMENHPGWELLVAPHAGQPWPKGYQGSPRIVVPTVRALVRQQESLMVKCIVLDHRPPASVTVAWRPLGDGEFRTVSTKQIARAVYEVALPPAAESFEYRIEVVTATGESLVWPSTAPTMNQTVVAW